MERVSDIQSSINDLSKEMSSLGLQPLATCDYSQPVEVCESLLNAAWHLVHEIHCISNRSGNAFLEDRESILRDEKQSLQIQLGQMEKKKEFSERKLKQEVETNRRLSVDIKQCMKELKIQEQQISNLQKKIKKQEDIHVHEIIKKEVENEHLRHLLQIRKITHAAPEDKVGRAFVSLSLSEDRASHKEVESPSERSVGRLMASNQELISENLMLRHSLRNIHADLALVLKTADSLKIFLDDSKTAEEINEDPLPENSFRLPLSHGMQVLAKLRDKQVSSLNEALSSFRSFVFHHTMSLN